MKHAKPVREDATKVEPARKSYFDKASFRKINISELIADAGLIVFALFFSKYLFKDVDILHTLKAWQLMCLYSAVVLTLPWYLGYIYAIYEDYYSKLVMRVVLIAFIVIVLFVLIYMIRIMFALNWLSDDQTSDKMMDIMGMFSLFLLVLGPMMSIGGFVAGKDDSNTIQKKDGDDDASPTGALMIIVMAIAFLVWWASYPYVQDHTWLFILVFFGSCFAAVIVYGLFLGLKHLLRKMGVYNFLAGFAGMSFPFFIVTILILWSDIGQHYVMLDFGGGNAMSFKYALLVLTIAGFIPFRLIMLFQPPLRLINILIGVAAFLFYMYSITA